LFQQIQRNPGVAARPIRQNPQHFIRRIDRKPPQPPLFVRQGATQNEDDLVTGQGFQAQHPQPRQQRGVHFEIRVFRCSADQNDRAVFDIRQQGILLRLVEPMDLIDKQDRAAIRSNQALAGLFHRLADIRHTGGNRIHLFKV